MITLLRRYWNELVSYDGGLSLVMLDGLLLIPLIFALFFYPLQVLSAIGILAVLTLAGYEGFVVWRRKHPKHV